MSRAPRIKTPGRSRSTDAAPPAPQLQKTFSSASRISEVERDELSALLPSVVQVFTEAAPPNWCASSSVIASSCSGHSISFPRFTLLSPALIFHALDPCTESREHPWTKSSTDFFTGSAVVVDCKNRLVMTNAHCAEFARTILLRREGQNDKFEARILPLSIKSTFAFSPSRMMSSGRVRCPCASASCRVCRTRVR